MLDRGQIIVGIITYVISGTCGTRHTASRGRTVSARVLDMGRSILRVAIVIDQHDWTRDAKRCTGVTMA